MRTAYRRQMDNGRRVRKVATSSLFTVLPLLGLAVFFLKASEQFEQAPVDWAQVVAVASFAVLMGIAGLAAMTRTARLTSSIVTGFRSGRARNDAPALPARFAERSYVPVLEAAFSLALLLGGLAMVTTGAIRLLQPDSNEESAVFILLLGLLLLFYFYDLLGWFPLIRQERDLLVIDETGLLASWVDPPAIAWSEIEEVRVIPGPDDPEDPETDIVLLVLRRPSSRWTNQVRVVDMDGQFGRSAKELLAVLDAARPPAVPLLDPRRLDGSESDAVRTSVSTTTTPGEPIFPLEPTYRRKRATRWFLVPQALGAAVLVAMIGGAYWGAVHTWLSLPEKIHLYEPAYRDQEIASALTATGLLVVPISVVAIVLFENFIRSALRQSAHTEGAARETLAARDLGPAIPVKLSMPIPRLLIGALGLAATGLGITTMLIYGAPWPGLLNLLMGGAITGAVAAATLRCNSRARRAPEMLTVDRAGLHVGSPVPFFLPWQAIGAITVGRGTRTGAGPENHVIRVYPRQTKAARLILQIEPRRSLELSPSAVLDALDRFRPADVPIDDPWRVPSSRTVE